MSLSSLRELFKFITQVSFDNYSPTLWQRSEHLNDEDSFFLFTKMDTLATSVFPSLLNWKAFEHQVNYILPQATKAALKNIVVTVSDQVERSRNMTWESQKVLDSRLGRNYNHLLGFHRTPWESKNVQFSLLVLDLWFKMKIKLRKKIKLDILNSSLNSRSSVICFSIQSGLPGSRVSLELMRSLLHVYACSVMSDSLQPHGL